MMHPKFQRGWYVSHIGNGIKGKIVDVITTPRGYEYTLLVGGTQHAYLTFSEVHLIREGVQHDKRRP